MTSRISAAYDAVSAITGTSYLEPLADVKRVDAWRRQFRPKTVRFLLVAESHVRRRQGPGFIYDPQYYTPWWHNLLRPAFGKDVTRQRLQELGVWILDMSVIALAGYRSVYPELGTNRPFDGVSAQIFSASWEHYVRHEFEEANCPHMAYFDRVKASLPVVFGTPLKFCVPSNSSRYSEPGYEYGTARFIQAVRDGGTMKRRAFLSAALVGLSAKADRPLLGGFVNDSFARGHMLRDGARFPAPKQSLKRSLVIVGGGMAALCAAWRLEKRGFRDYVILEMEPAAGGNSRSGANAVSAYPWGAHYLPVPNAKATLARELCEDLGLLRNGEWDERALCFAPQERLYIQGRWQEEIEPQFDAPQMKRFGERMREFRATGEFTIPSRLGARKSSPLDRTNMQSWMREQGFTSPYVNWFVDYSCRDDYGASARDTSAWAGIHYFASREPEEKGPLTWPEGNGWILKRLLERVGSRVRANSMVSRIARNGSRWRVIAEQTEWDCDAVIYAAPTFLASRLIEDLPPFEARQYSPWLTANLTLDRLPRAMEGAEPAWDNVIYGSPSLGYVDATHQSLSTRKDRSVWTYYWALAEGTPAENRKALLARDWGWWRDAILRDLERAHPDIRTCVARMDIMRFGHAMARPTPGFLSVAQPECEGICFANSDLSGFSIFEEAQYWGVRAADRTLEGRLHG